MFSFNLQNIFQIVWTKFILYQIKTFFTWIHLFYIIIYENHIFFKISSTVYPSEIVTWETEINLWLIIGSVIGGLVVFILLGVILWKVSGTGSRLHRFWNHILCGKSFTCENTCNDWLLWRPLCRPRPVVLIPVCSSCLLHVL